MMKLLVEWVMLLLAVAVQPDASVTVTVYVPAVNPLISSVVAALDQLYVTAPVAPVTARSQ